VIEFAFPGRDRDRVQFDGNRLRQQSAPLL